MEISQEIMKMGLVDGIIVLVIAGSAVYSVIKGFIKELFLIIALLLGLVAATKFYAPVSDVLLSWIGHPTISAVVGFLAVFLLVAILLIIVGNTISKLIHFAKLGCLDRLLGGILGIFKGILICGIGCTIILTFTPRGGHVLRDSVLAPRVLSFTSAFFSLFPSDVKERLERRLKNLEEWRETATSGCSMAAQYAVAGGGQCGAVTDGDSAGILRLSVDDSCLCTCALLSRLPCSWVDLSNGRV